MCLCICGYLIFNLFCLSKTSQLTSLSTICIFENPSSGTAKGTAAQAGDRASECALTAHLRALDGASVRARACGRPPALI